jgi:hypothetical protein
MKCEEPETPRESSLVSVHKLANRFEADLLVGALEQEGIQAVVRCFEETPYDGLFIPQRGWGLIMVTEDMAERAREIINPLARDFESKGLYVDPANVDPELWEKLIHADPGLIGLNAQIRHDASNGAYIVPFLNETLRCYPEREHIELDGPESFCRPNFEMYLTVLHYLLEAQNIGLSGKWISEKDIPGGELFFRGPHAFPVASLLEIFGSRVEIFRAASEKLGGTRVNMGDAAYRFWAFPRVPLLFVLWKGDDEFEPSLNIRFDGSIHRQLRTLDTIWAMINVVCGCLRRASRSVL